ncbi:hypothetical protein HOLleu_39274 [Holothuria leucospilota]|uniref:Reverse transcriptase domain-containing protein n=1 Tax=Holothuria leucospilota TaxID=206669 RepID=A0A9Q1BER6_HOLLE|nr:hypothetical protein HOLleu_39274 [Holothuria leucospilota]
MLFCYRICALVLSSLWCFLLTVLYIYYKPGNSGRPTVSSHTCPTVLISEYIDSVLSPLVSKLPSFFQDTPHFLRLIQDCEFPKGDGEQLLFTVDVSSLYKSIPHHAALVA